MQFAQIINAAISKENDRPLMQKEIFPVSEGLKDYLQEFGRDILLPVNYQDLLHYEYTNAIKGADGKHTHWENVIYKKETFTKLEKQLLATYELLQRQNFPGYRIKTVDYCEYANSMPFRILVEDTATGSEDLFYIKTADASRLYGLELEELLSTNPINYFYHSDTLIEAHIPGEPGDLFLKKIPAFSPADQKKLAEEFVRFNERCFRRLLGDMRSYNFVVLHNVGPGNKSFHLRAIDFDQQCYEGRANLYFPQYYKENFEYVELVLDNHTVQELEAIRLDERRQMHALYTRNHDRLTALLNVMALETLSDNYKVVSLQKQLNDYHPAPIFGDCRTMGEVLARHLAASFATFRS